MNSVNFRTADLNLFRVFVTLLEEKNATRAGERLGLSQSAVSHALRRLREMVVSGLRARCTSSTAKGSSTGTRSPR
ncbi:MAG: LysR family transcriptional regulator [Thermoanaerobaculia bacterium]